MINVNTGRKQYKNEDKVPLWTLFEKISQCEKKSRIQEYIILRESSISMRIYGHESF